MSSTVNDEPLGTSHDDGEEWGILHNPLMNVAIDEYLTQDARRQRTGPGCPHAGLNCRVLPVGEPSPPPLSGQSCVPSSLSLPASASSPWITVQQLVPIIPEERNDSSTVMIQSSQQQTQLMPIIPEERNDSNTVIIPSSNTVVIQSFQQQKPGPVDEIHCQFNEIAKSIEATNMTKDAIPICPVSRASHEDTLPLNEMPVLRMNGFVTKDDTLAGNCTPTTDPMTICSGPGPSEGDPSLLIAAPKAAEVAETSTVGVIQTWPLNRIQIPVPVLDCLTCIPLTKCLPKRMQKGTCGKIVEASSANSRPILSEAVPADGVVSASTKMPDVVDVLVADSTPAFHDSSQLFTPAVTRFHSAPAFHDSSLLSNVKQDEPVPTSPGIPIVERRPQPKMKVAKPGSTQIDSTPMYPGPGPSDENACPLSTMPAGPGPSERDTLPLNTTSVSMTAPTPDSNPICPGPSDRDGSPSKEMSEAIEARADSMPFCPGPASEDERIIAPKSSRLIPRWSGGTSPWDRLPKSKEFLEKDIVDDPPSQDDYGFESPIPKENGVHGGECVEYEDTPHFEYLDEDGSSIRKLVRFQLSFHSSTQVSVYVNNFFQHVVGAVEYDALTGEVWTCAKGPPPRQPQHWRGSTLSFRQAEEVVEQLWSFAMQAEGIVWYGQAPVSIELCVGKAVAAPILFNREVWLNVYDLSNTARILNDAILRKFQLGMFHCGVEVFGTEYSFVCFSPHNRNSGIAKSKPRQAETSDGHYIYKDSVHMGTTKLTKRRVDELILLLGNDWTSDSYHITHRNCLSFADVFSKALGAHVDVPSWITNACRVSRNSAVLDFIVDQSMELSKRWTSK